jgi:hypothetical protein
MKDEQKASLFRELVTLSPFQAQVSLEEEVFNSLLNKLQSIDLNQSNVQLEYAKIRGSIDVLKLLRATRERFVEQARSRLHS